MNVLTLSKLVGEANGAVENVDFILRMDNDGIHLMLGYTGDIGEKFIVSRTIIKSWSHDVFSREDGITNEMQWLEEVADYLTNCIKYQAVRDAEMMLFIQDLKAEGASSEALAEMFDLPEEVMGGIA